MYVQLASGAVTADVLALETCGTLQNVHDKRSRFLASTGSLLLLIPARWLGETQQVQHGAVHERWRTFGGAFADRPLEDVRVPVARLRVFLFVPDDHLESIAEKIALEPHEYLLPHSAFNNQYHPKLKALLAHAFDSRVWQ